MSAMSWSSVTRTPNHGRDAAAARRTATRSSRRGRSTGSLARATRDTIRSTSPRLHCVLATSATARWPRVSGLNDPGKAPLRVGPAIDAPAVVPPVQHDERAGGAPDQAAAGVSSDEQAGKALDVGEVTDEHHVLIFGVEPGRPARRVVVRRQAGCFLGGRTDEFGPYLGRLPGSGFVRVEDPGRFDRKVRH